MQAYHAVLYIHLLSLLIATGASAVMHVSDVEMRRAQTLGEVGRAGMRAKSAAMTFPLAVVGLVGSGIYMGHHIAWGWTSAWLLAGMVGLFAIVVLGDGVNGRHGRKLGATIGATIGRSGDGPVTDEVRALLADPIGKVASVAPTTLMLGIVYVMTEKPGAVGSALALAISLVAAGVIAPLLLRTPAAALAEAQAPELA